MTQRDTLGHRQRLVNNPATDFAFSLLIGNKQIPVIVLGLSLTGLNAIRTFGRARIPTIGIDVNPNALGFKSRYGHKILLQSQNESQMTDNLIQLGKTMGSSAFLLPTNDLFLNLISRHFRRFTSAFIVSTPPLSVLNMVLDKALFFSSVQKLGYAVPRTEMLTSEDVESGILKIGLPCIIKPRNSRSRDWFDVKALRVNTLEEVKAFATEESKTGADFVLQELVESNGNSQFSLCAYMSQDNEPLDWFITHKIRQYPPLFGTGTLVETCKNNFVEEIGIKLLKEVKYCGIAEVEFIQDMRDRQWKVLEINARPWMQMDISTKLGQNFGLLAYSESIQRLKIRKSPYRRVKWYYLANDLLTIMGNEGRANGLKVTFWQWLRSLVPNLKPTLFQIDDVKPWLCRQASFIQESLKSLSLRFKKKVA